MWLWLWALGSGLWALGSGLGLLVLGFKKKRSMEHGSGRGVSGVCALWWIGDVGRWSRSHILYRYLITITALPGVVVVSSMHIELTAQINRQEHGLLPKNNQDWTFVERFPASVTLLLASPLNIQTFRKSNRSFRNTLQYCLGK